MSKHVVNICALNIATFFLCWYVHDPATVWTWAVGISFQLQNHCHGSCTKKGATKAAKLWNMSLHILSLKHMCWKQHFLKLMVELVPHRLFLWEALTSHSLYLEEWNENKKSCRNHRCVLCFQYIKRGWDVVGHAKSMMSCKILRAQPSSHAHGHASKLVAPCWSILVKWNSITEACSETKHAAIKHLCQQSRKASWLYKILLALLKNKQELYQQTTYNPLVCRNDVQTKHLDPPGVHFVMFDRTFVIWWRSLSDVGTFGFAPGRQLKSFWLELSGWCAHLFLCHGWLGARSDPITDASIARPWFVWKCWLYIWVNV